jgi:hypothetical protein
MAENYHEQQLLAVTVTYLKELSRYSPAVPEESHSTL